MLFYMVVNKLASLNPRRGHNIVICSNITFYFLHNAPVFVTVVIYIEVKFKCDIWS